MCLYPGPTTLLVKGYASPFEILLRKGIFLEISHVLDFSKKGPFLPKSSQCGEKGPSIHRESQHF